MTFWSRWITHTELLARLKRLQAFSTPKVVRFPVGTTGQEQLKKRA